MGHAVPTNRELRADLAASRAEQKAHHESFCKELKKVRTSPQAQAATEIKSKRARNKLVKS